MAEQDQASPRVLRSAEETEEIRASMARYLEGSDCLFTGVKVTVIPAPERISALAGTVFTKGGHSSSTGDRRLTTSQIDLSVYLRFETDQGTFGYVHSVFSAYDLEGSGIAPHDVIPAEWKEMLEIPSGSSFIPMLPYVARKIREAMEAKAAKSH